MIWDVSKEISGIKKINLNILILIVVFPNYIALQVEWFYFVIFTASSILSISVPLTSNHFAIAEVSNFGPLTASLTTLTISSRASVWRYSAASASLVVLCEDFTFTPFLGKMFLRGGFFWQMLSSLWVTLRVTLWEMFSSCFWHYQSELVIWLGIWLAISFSAVTWLVNLWLIGLVI